MKNTRLQPGFQCSERVIRATFWTLVLNTGALTVYGLAVELFGIGLFVANQLVPKLHMTVEADWAVVLSSITGIALTLMCLFIRCLSRAQRFIGYGIVFIWLFYFALPRF